MLPVEQLEGQPLNYPLGVHDFTTLFDKRFHPNGFRTTPQYYFMGAADDNDAVPYDDAYDDDEREVIYSLLGKTMQPNRWRRCVEVYRQLKIDAQCIVYGGIGHEHPDRVKADVIDFFRQQIEVGS